jgi:hypothetical protein
VVLLQEPVDHRHVIGRVGDGLRLTDRFGHPPEVVLVPLGDADDAGAQDLLVVERRELVLVDLRLDVPELRRRVAVDDGVGAGLLDLLGARPVAVGVQPDLRVDLAELAGAVAAHVLGKLVVPLAGPRLAEVLHQRWPGEHHGGVDAAVVVLHLAQGEAFCCCGHVDLQPPTTVGDAVVRRRR